MERNRSRIISWTFVALITTLAACGSDNGAPPGDTPTPTRTPTRTATTTPTATPTLTSGGVSGLVVVRQDVTARSTDALGAPPPVWAPGADAEAFDRSLAQADWSVAEQPDKRGTTSSDGRFAISGLPPGDYTLNVTKTLDGNLAALAVPFAVGDLGDAEVVAEMAWGLVRAVSTYSKAGVQVRQVHGPYGTEVTIDDGRLSTFSDGSRTLIDPDGDGRFECDVASAGDICRTVAIAAVSINGPSQLVRGQQGALYASAVLSDGTTFDVTYLADWTSSNEQVATVDSWGTLSALASGAANLTATVGTLASKPWPLDVVDRPALRKIYVQNVSCFFPRGGPLVDNGTTPPVLSAPPRGDILPVPNCTQVVLIGDTLQFQALGEFDNGYYQDITSEVQWQVAPPAVGDVVAGLFTGRKAGTAKLSAALGTVVSDATEITVVTEPTVVGLSIYTDNGGYPVILGQPVAGRAGDVMPCLAATASDGPCCCPGPLAEDLAAPCHCNYSITVLRGDQLKFHATAQYNTGAWQDVTDKAVWRSSDTAVATIESTGVMTAVQGGDATIDATFAAVTSNAVDIHVVNQATLQSLYIYQESGNRVVTKGDQRFFHATGYYDVGFSRDVTTDASWHRNPSRVGDFDTPGAFTGRAAGDVEVWAELAGQQSPRLSLEVFETSALDYCDLANINRAVWSDDFNRVTLESDCASYPQSGVVTLRYTVTETQPHGGIFNPCLDLYVYQGSQRVRTVREEGCGDPFLASAPNRDAEEVLKYQLRAFWDLRDDSGAPVDPGTYKIYGRFYLYYDPVVSIDVTLLSSGGSLPTRPPTPTTTPAVECTPPTCGSDEVFSCPSTCPGGCGTVCATPTPVPTLEPTPQGEGACFRGPGPDKCTGSSFFTSQRKCCELSREIASPLPLSWCFVDVLDTATGQCAVCGDPCAGVPSPPPLPEPTIEPTPQAEGACFKGPGACVGTSFLTSKSRCCTISQLDASLVPISWCPADQLDATGKCNACSSQPCDSATADGQP